MKIYNTLTRKKEEFQPLEEGKVKMYVCGPTVYNLIHIGNARPMICFDTVRRYLEYKGYRLANKVKRYNLTENKQEPKKPHLPEHQQDAMDDYFEDCKFLTSFIGCNLFEEEKKEDATGQLTFYLTRKNCNAKGVYTSEGMTVLRDSHVVKECSPSYKNRSKREEWLKKYTYDKNGEHYLKSDYSFDSPSTASSYCLGCSSNGWVDWKTRDKRSLDSIFRL